MKIKNKLKQTEIGMIPQDWRIDRLSNLLYIKGRIGWKGLNKSEYLMDGTGIAIINGLQIQNNSLKWEKLGRVPIERYEESPEIQLQDKDIIMTKDGTLGKVAFIKKLPEKASVASGIFVIRSISNLVDQKYLFYYFTSPFFKWLIESRKEGSVIPHLYQRDFEQLFLPIPYISEQKAIAKILYDLDSKIETLQKQNETLEGIGQLLFKRWFVDFEFPDGDSNGYKSNGGKMIESELGEIPEGWKVDSLDNIANYLNGLALQKYPSKKGEPFLPVIKIRELNQGLTDNTDKASLEIPKEYIVKNGDILFSWSGSLKVIVWGLGKGALNQHLFKVTSKKYEKWFYYYWTLYHLEKFKVIAESKATTMGHIKREHLRESEVLIPNEKILVKMNKVMNPTIETLINNKIEVRLLTKLRDTLLPKLMSGKVRVK